MPRRGDHRRAQSHWRVGAAIAEWTSDYGSDLTALLRFGTGCISTHEAGGTDYARTRHGLSVEPIVEAITGSTVRNVLLADVYWH